MCDGVDDDAPVVIAYIERDEAVVGAGIVAVFDDDDDELTAIVKTTRDETVVVAAVLVDEDVDAKYHLTHVRVMMLEVLAACSNSLR